MSRSRRGSASRAALDKRSERRGSIGVSRHTLDLVREAARRRGWTIERFADVALLAALLFDDGAPT